MNDNPNPVPPKPVPAQVIDLIEGTRLSIRVENRHPCCPHNAITVNMKTRTVFCRDCENEIDPLEALVKLARGEQQLEWARDQRKEISAQIEELKRELVNLKAKERRLSRKVECDCEKFVRKRPWLKR